MMGLVEGDLGFFLEIVVVHLDDEHDAAACGGDEVGDEQRPDDLGLVEQALEHEAETADGHHQEGGQGYALGVARADGLNGLGQIAQHHGDAGNEAANLVERILLHRCIYI